MSSFGFECRGAWKVNVIIHRWMDMRKQIWGCPWSSLTFWVRSLQKPFQTIVETWWPWSVALWPNWQSAALSLNGGHCPYSWTWLSENDRKSRSPSAPLVVAELAVWSVLYRFSSLLVFSLEDFMYTHYLMKWVFFFKMLNIQPENPAIRSVYKENVMLK